MRLITMISLGASAVLGVAALVVAKTALPAVAGAHSAAATAQQTLPMGSKPVVVAAQDIKFGDRLDASHLRLVELPPGAAPEGAFTTIEAALAQDDGGAPVALTPIAAREPILPTKLSGPGARPSVAAEIGEGMRAYTIKVTDVSGVGGHALPGDRVDVMLMRNLAADATGDAPRNLVADVVLQDVRVLGMDLNADPTSNKPQPPSTATLEVKVKDAQKLAVAASLGDLSLALRRNGAAGMEPVARIRGADVGLGGRIAAAPMSPRQGAKATPVRPLIIVVEGDEPRRGAGAGA